MSYRVNEYRVQSYSDCRYGGDWTGDSLDCLVAALGPRLTSLALHYVDGVDLGALALLSTCCQGLVTLKLGALVGRLEEVEEPYMAQARRTQEAEVGRRRQSCSVTLFCFS